MTDGSIEAEMAEATYARGTRQSLIQTFVIEGLYGYRRLSLDSDYAATIIIAKNGSGKTTLLAALYAFLKGHFARLRELEFSVIRCQIRGLETELLVTKEDVAHLSEAADTGGELAKAARRYEVPPNDLFNFLEREFIPDISTIDEMSEHKVFSQIMRTHGFSRREAVEACNKLRDIYYSSSPHLATVRQALSSVFSNIELVYLPTYRRIELPLTDTDVSERPQYRRRRTNFKFSESGLSPGSVQFGLADISERLSQLNQRLLTDSSLSYREISANIINELIDGTFERPESTQQVLPDREELELFFARLKDGRRRVGPYADATIPDIDKIYSREGISIESNRVLTYFLGKLNSAILATRDIEVMVEQFISVCNKYLSRIDPTTMVDDDRSINDDDGKFLVLDRLNLKVYVESIALNRRIGLNSLSSGEKQMISMFGSLYLYEKEKVVLIDEPELSLSIDWQRQLLIDLLNAPTCRQIIAITHSPFVFDNELEPFARAMTSQVDVSMLSAVPDEDLDGND